MENPQKTLLLKLVNELIENIDKGKEKNKDVPESIEKLFKTLKLIGMSSESEYDILKHYNMLTGNEKDDYIILQEIIT